MALGSLGGLADCVVRIDFDQGLPNRYLADLAPELPLPPKLLRIRFWGDPHPRVTQRHRACDLAAA